MRVYRIMFSILDLFLTTFTRLMLCGRDPVKVVSSSNRLEDEQTIIFSYFLYNLLPSMSEGKRAMRAGELDCVFDRPVVLFLYSGPRSHYKRTTFEGLRPSRTAGASLRRTAVYRREEIFHFQFQTRFNFVNNIWNWNRKWK